MAVKPGGLPLFDLPARDPSSGLLHVVVDTPKGLVPVRLIGVVEAKQTQEGVTHRNDRLIGAAEKSRTYRGLRRIGDVPDHLLKEIEHFFISYNEERGRRFEVLGRFGPDRAARLVEAAARLFRQKRRGRKKKDS